LLDVVGNWDKDDLVEILMDREDAGQDSGEEEEEEGFDYMEE